MTVVFLCQLWSLWGQPMLASIIVTEQPCCHDNDKLGICKWNLP